MADDQNAVTIKSASYTSSGLLLLFYTIIKTLPRRSPAFAVLLASFRHWIVVLKGRLPSLSISG